jgi:hypothetical protein
VKRSSALFAILCLSTPFWGRSDVAAAARGEDIVPLSPTTRTLGIVAAVPVDDAVRFEVAGAPDAPFMFLYVLRRPDGVLMCGPGSSVPFVGMLCGQTVPASGVWSYEINALSLAVGMPDYIIEAVAVPTTPGVVGHVLSWRTSITKLTLPPGSPAPPELTTDTEQIPGVEGVFTTTTLIVPDPVESDQYYAFYSGPGGVFPVG